MVEEVFQRIQECEHKQPASLLYSAARILERVDACVEELNYHSGEFSLLLISGDSIVFIKVTFLPNFVESTEMKLEVKVHPFHTLQHFELLFDSPDLRNDLLNNGRIFSVFFENGLYYQISLIHEDPRTNSLNEFFKAIKYRISYPPAPNILVD